jgi:hypothetical protein
MSTERMRKAAAALDEVITGSSSIVVLTDGILAAIRDVLLSEADTRENLEPLTKYLNAIYEQQTGVKGYLKFGYQEDGEILMDADSSEAVMALAEQILGGAS